MPAKTQETSIEQHRVEIEERTNNGESCEKVASALRDQGFEVSAKTISRYRVAWGLRKRAAGTLGRKYPDRRRPPGATSTPSKTKAQNARKARIVEWTNQGKSAEQIAAILEGEGTTFKGGASSVWRLQTLWGLVPYDEDRARGKGMYKKNPVPPEKRRGSRKKQMPAEEQDQADAASSGQVLHYPSNCANGPQKRLGPNKATAPAGMQQAMNSVSYNNRYAGPGPSAAMDVDSNNSQAQSDSAGIADAAELMQAELLIDLATSTLAAAHKVKELYLAQQARQPVPGSTTGLPPTTEDLAGAKTKVREAAAVMHDMAMPNAASS